MPNIESKLPPLTEYQLFIKYLKKKEIPIESVLPSNFIDEKNTILNLKGTALSQLLGGVINCGTGLFLYVLGGKLAKECISLKLLEQYTLAASPLMIGGILRIWATAQTDAGYGKETIIKLLSLSLVGVIGHVVFLSFNSDLSRIEANSWQYPYLIFCNVLSGVGIATYSAGMTLGAAAAPNDTPDIWRTHLDKLSQLLNTKLKAGFFEEKFAPIIRSNAAQYLAIIAGMSNLAPGIALIASVFLIPKLGLRNTYLFFAGITFLGILATIRLVHDTPYDQLQHQNPQLSHEKAQEIAKYCGQTRFSSEKGFWPSLLELNKRESIEVFNATFDYTITFGVLTAMTSMGAIILNQRQFSIEEGSLTIAGVSMLSASMRTLMTLCPPVLTPKKIILSSFAMMIALTAIFASQKDKISSNLCLILFGLVNGVGNFAVVARISEALPEKIGLATGISSGIAAFLAFPMSIGMAYSEWFAPGLCAFGLGIRLMECIQTPANQISPLK